MINDLGARTLVDGKPPPPVFIFFSFFIILIFIMLSTFHYSHNKIEIVHLTKKFKRQMYQNIRIKMTKRVKVGVNCPKNMKLY